MKTAQEIRVGNVVMVSNEPMVVLKTEYTKSGRNSSVCKMKMKNLLTDAGLESIDTVVSEPIQNEAERLP